VDHTVYNLITAQLLSFVLDSCVTLLLNICSYAAHEVENNSSKSFEQQNLLVTKRQEVVLLENEITFNEAIIEEREQGIKEVQQQISEVNEIFKDLADLVHVQGGMIDDIGSNIENSHSATVQATSHLKRASKIQRANSSTVSLIYLIFPP
ncbi:hypothetical protein Golax_019354, partial [Gossypium laxum]|nr:hypothetical protein [Gossypium laxum]